MKKETLLVAFSTQKGGAGKTTLTVLMASYFYYVKGMDVVVVDCDYPQFSIKDMRERDLKNIERLSLKWKRRRTSSSLTCPVR